MPTPRFRWPKRLPTTRSGYIGLLLTLLIALFSSYVASQQPSTTAEHESLPPSTTGWLPVVRVVDGDTIVVEQSGEPVTVRLIGIDTPESVDPRRPVQCFGREASQKMRELVGGQAVRLEPDPTQADRDAYQRLLRYIYLDGDVSVNQILIAEGFAFEYTYQNVPYRDQAAHREAERQARESGAGLWDPQTCAGERGAPVRSR
jgi:micrococcal nuclease